VCEIRGKPGANDSGSASQQLCQRALPDAVPVVRGMVARFLARLGVSASRSGDIQLAVTEACTNVVRHAYPGGHGDVLCECEATRDEIVIRVSDWGIGTDQRSAQPSLGLGIPLIERLSDHATRSHSQGGTLVEMHFARSSQPAT
jgi:serine/threonine-protein kinase RsbW